MSTPQPFLTTTQGTRRFACSAIAVQAIIVNTDERVLLLSSADEEPARRVAGRQWRPRGGGNRPRGGPAGSP